MKPNAEKNQKLLKQFPFLRDILYRKFVPLDEFNGTRIDGMTIKVEKADANLIFRVASNLGISDASYLFSTGGPLTGFVAKQAEYLFAIDRQGVIVNSMVWPWNDEERQRDIHIYAGDILWKTKNGPRSFSDNIADKVEYLIWVTVQSWHKDTRDPFKPFGSFYQRFVHSTVYKKPDCGFYDLARQASINENLILNDNILIIGLMQKDDEIQEMRGQIAELGRLFQDEVFFNGLQTQMNGKSVSGRFGAVQIAVVDVSDLYHVMMEDERSHVAFNVRRQTECPAILSAFGTLPQIRHLVKTVTKAWREEPQVCNVLKPK